MHMATMADTDPPPSALDLLPSNQRKKNISSTTPSLDSALGFWQSGGLLRVGIFASEMFMTASHMQSYMAVSSNVTSREVSRVYVRILREFTSNVTR